MSSSSPEEKTPSNEPVSRDTNLEAPQELEQSNGGFQATLEEARRLLQDPSTPEELKITLAQCVEQLDDILGQIGAIVTSSEQQRQPSATPPAESANQPSSETEQQVPETITRENLARILYEEYYSDPPKQRENQIEAALLASPDGLSEYAKYAIDLGQTAEDTAEEIVVLLDTIISHLTTQAMEGVPQQPIDREKYNEERRKVVQRVLDFVQTNSFSNIDALTRFQLIEAMLPKDQVGASQINVISLEFVPWFQELLATAKAELASPEVEPRSELLQAAEKVQAGLMKLKEGLRAHGFDFEVEDILDAVQSQRPIITLDAEEATRQASQDVTEQMIKLGLSPTQQHISTAELLRELPMFRFTESQPLDRLMDIHRLESQLLANLDGLETALSGYQDAFEPFLWFIEQGELSFEGIIGQINRDLEEYNRIKLLSGEDLPDELQHIEELRRGLSGTRSWDKSLARLNLDRIAKVPEYKFQTQLRNQRDLKERLARIPRIRSELVQIVNERQAQYIDIVYRNLNDSLAGYQLDLTEDGALTLSEQSMELSAEQKDRLADLLTGKELIGQEAGDTQIQAIAKVLLNPLAGEYLSLLKIIEMKQQFLAYRYSLRGEEAQEALQKIKDRASSDEHSGVKAFAQLVANQLEALPQ